MLGIRRIKMDKLLTHYQIFYKLKKIVEDLHPSLFCYDISDEEKKCF